MIRGPASIVWSSFQNLDAFAEISGERAAAALRRRAADELGRLGATFAAGDDLVTVVGGEVGQTSDRLRPLSWLTHALVGITEAWRLHAKGEDLEGLVPRRLLELSAGLRFGVVALDANIDAALARAKRMTDEQKRDKRGITRFGFPPLWPERFRTLTQIADPSCPACAGRPEVLSNVGDTSRERCTRCELEYDRHRVWLVGGRQV